MESPQEILRRGILRGACGSIIEPKIRQTEVARLTAENDQLHAANEKHVETCRKLRTELGEKTAEIAKLKDRIIMAGLLPDEEPALLPAKRPSIAEIVYLVAEHFELDIIDIASNRREQKIVMPRQIAMYLAKRLTIHSLATIGQAIGDRDHTTVMHAVGQIKKRREVEPELNQHVVAVENEIARLFNSEMPVS